jgi:hypothetical protein
MKNVKQNFWRNLNRPKIICYCGSLRVALDAFKKAEYESVQRGEIALLPCCMFVDIQREYGAESDYKLKADELHKRKIDWCDKVVVLNVNNYIGESTLSEIKYALRMDKKIEFLNPLSIEEQSKFSHEQLLKLANVKKFKNPKTVHLDNGKIKVVEGE